MKTRTILQTVHIHATPREVYDALMNQKRHAQFTGEPARIRAKTGAAFRCYGEYITGITLELEPAKHLLSPEGQEEKGEHDGIVFFSV